MITADFLRGGPFADVSSPGWNNLQAGHTSEFAGSVSYFPELSLHRFNFLRFSIVSDSGHGQVTSSIPRLRLMSGARLRKDFGDHHSQGRGNSPGRESPGLSRPLRIVASGVIFVTHTLSLLSFPEEGSNSRAQAVNRVRGGSAAASLSVLAQFSDVKSWLLAPIGSGPEGAAIRIELEREGISTQLCPKREADGVPKAFVLRSGCVPAFHFHLVFQAI